jgi:hypothetical protein
MDKTLTFTAEESNSTIKLSKVGSPVINGLQYRLNANDDWQRYKVGTEKVGTEIVLENVGDYVQFQNINNELSTSNQDYVYFIMTGKIAASGNIQSMLNYSTSCMPYCYYRIFAGCASLTKVPELPVTNLAKYCYASMFWCCTSLTNAPELPATTLATGCYSFMFSYCTELTKTPKLPGINLAKNCYQYMFNCCESLTEAPKLPATTLVNDCYYNMFAGCINLIEAPELPATTLAYNCYFFMFSGCASLKSKPKINNLIEKMVYIS